MATTSDQIQADIARTRADMTARLDSMRPATTSGTSMVTGGGGAQGILTTITEQVRRRPLAALGLSLVAGSLLQNVVSGGGSSSGTTTTSTTGNGATGALSQAGSTVSQTASSATDTVTSAAQSAGQTVSGAAQQAANTTTDMASSAAETATDTAQQAASTVAGAASTVADTATSTAQQVASTTTDAAQSVAQTATDAAQQVAQTATQTASSVTTSASQGVGNIGTTVTQQVHQRPLAALGLAVGAGALAQPVLAPQVSAVTQGISTQVGRLTQSLSAATPDGGSSSPHMQEIERISQALVPATVDRARQFVSRDLRELLDSNLEAYVSQASLRAGIVGSITERAEQLADSRLPTVLGSTLSGTRGLILASLAAAILRARNEVQQGQGQLGSNMTSNFVQSLTQSATEQLSRHFPEFRERYQQLSQEQQSQQ